MDPVALTAKVAFVATREVWVELTNTETGKKIIKSETSEVSFNELSAEMIKEYILNFKPYDKAGSYGIQELPEGWVRETQGEYDNIIGFPSNLAKSMLKEFGLM